MMTRKSTDERDEIIGWTSVIIVLALPRLHQFYDRILIPDAIRRAPQVLWNHVGTEIESIVQTYGKLYLDMPIISTIKAHLYDVVQEYYGDQVAHDLLHIIETIFVNRTSRHQLDAWSRLLEWISKEENRVEFDRVNQLFSWWSRLRQIISETFNDSDILAITNTLLSMEKDRMTDWEIGVIVAYRRLFDDSSEIDLESPIWILSEAIDLSRAYSVLQYASEALIDEDLAAFAEWGQGMMNHLLRHRVEVIALRLVLGHDI